MAAKRINPISRASSRPVQRGSEVKEAAKKAPADDSDRTYTHQGPGTGQAGAADPKASAAILNSGKSTTSTADSKSTSTTESRGTAPVVETKATSPVTEAKTAPAESAGEAIRERLAEERLKLGASGDDDTGTLPTPRTPGQQTGDGGTAGTGPGMGGGKTSSEAAAGGSSGSAASSGESAGSGTATSEGGRDPFGNSAAMDRLDAATASALSQLDAARPDLRGGLDVFQSRTESSTPAGSGSSHEDQLAAAAEGSKSTPGQTASDPGAEHAADVAGQVTGGPGSTGSMFGDRLAGLQSDLAIAGGLMGDQTAKADSPGAADGGNLITQQALRLAEKAADGDDDAYRKLERLADEMHKDREGTAGATAGLGYGVGTNADGEVVAPAGDPSPGADSPFWKSVADMFMGTRDAAGNLTPRGEALKEAEGGGVDDPGDPNNPDGGMPTPAQIAFRQSLRQALGGAQTGSGDIDPADNGGAPVGGSNFAGAANDNMGLIGQPAGPGTGASGTVHSPTTGTDVDPLEGSAFSGPALGGNPEDLQFGSATLPLDSLPRSSSSDDDDSSEDGSSKDEDDDA